MVSSREKRNKIDDVMHVRRRNTKTYPFLSRCTTLGMPFLKLPATFHLNLRLEFSHPLFPDLRFTCYGLINPLLFAILNFLQRGGMSPLQVGPKISFSFLARVFKCGHGFAQLLLVLHKQGISIGNV